jgi:hypothetical protein
MRQSRAFDNPPLLIAYSLRLVLFAVMWKRPEVDDNFLDLVSLRAEVLSVAKFCASFWFTFITKNGFLTFFKKLLDVKSENLLTERPALLKMSRLTNVIIERTAKSEVIAQ